MINHVVEIDFDTCANVYGSAPCSASLGAGLECYNTKKTCQDEPNFARAVKTVSFSESNNRPIDGAFPCIEEIEFAATKIDPKESLDYLGKVEIKAIDFTHHDRGIDPYVSTRNYIASDQGTFWGKALARSPHHFGRKLRVKRIVDGVVQNTYSFLIESISPPSSKGIVKIVARDPLFLAGGDKAKAPKATLGVLTSDITDSAGSLSLDDATEYPSSGLVRIGREIIAYSGKSGNTLTGLTRGQWGSTASDHRADSNAQICLAYTDTPMIDVVNDLITNYTTIENSFVPFAKWQQEQADWLTVYTLTNIISEPTDVLDLLTEIQVSTGTAIWWDQELQEINLKASVPRTQNQQVTSLNDTQNLMKPIEVKEQSDDRMSQVWIYYGVKDYTERDEATNFLNLEVRTDLDSETAEEYGTEQVETIYSRWLTGTAQAGQVASRKLSRYRDPPKTISFSLDSKDSALKTGDHFYLRTAAIQSVTGAPQEIEMQMLSMRPIPKSMTFKCQAQTFNYLLDQIYAFVAPNGTPDHSVASSSDKFNYGFIAQNDGNMPDGTKGYLII